MKVLQEITDWGENNNTPNHTYHVNDAGKLVAYIKSGTKKLTKITHPMRFETARRKFKTLEIIEEEIALPPGAKKVTGSKGQIYIVVDNTCTCPGFKFRGKCRHLQ